jgi:hypothetical protein
MSLDDSPKDEQPNPASSTGESLADTTAELHEEGKALSDQSKDLAEVLSEKLQRGDKDA